MEDGEVKAMGAGIQSGRTEERVCSRPQARKENINRSLGQ